MLMPKRLLGRSRTCPLLATTSKSSPRYLLIVFALAGDSTITRFFFFFAATDGSLRYWHRGSGWVARPAWCLVGLPSPTYMLLGQVGKPDLQEVRQESLTYK